MANKNAKRALVYGDDPSQAVSDCILELRANGFIASARAAHAWDGSIERADLVVVLGDHDQIKEAYRAIGVEVGDNSAQSTQAKISKDDASLNELKARAIEFGVKFDGRTNAAKLKELVDAAAAKKEADDGQE